MFTVCKMKAMCSSRYNSDGHARMVSGAVCRVSIVVRLHSYGHKSTQIG